MMKSKKTLTTWLNEYGVSHQNPLNKKIHIVCVPIIFLTIAAMLYLLSPIALLVVSIFILIFYLRLSMPLFVFMACGIALCALIAHYLPIGFIGWIAIFVIAWIGQFIGHKVEGAKPSFFEDLQFLLIGPAWVALLVMGKLPPKTTPSQI